MGPRGKGAGKGGSRRAQGNSRVGTVPVCEALAGIHKAGGGVRVEGGCWIVRRLGRRRAGGPTMI